MEEHIDVDEFMAYVREQGFEIQDNLFTRGIRTFVISGGGLPKDGDVHFDITREEWNKLTLEDLIQQVNSLRYMVDERNDKARWT
ncbi:MAG TPA: hypothetical protein VF974_06045 [Patescibacteria group bacterium]